MLSSRNIITNYRFQPVGKAIRVPGSLLVRFQANANYVETEHGWVYAWVLTDVSGLFQISYIGMAGKTVMRRQEQHHGGFKGGSKKGVWNNDAIASHIDAAAGNEVLLFARKSDTMTILGETICMVASEETAMIQKCISNGISLWNS
jgi:hypothetical protein